MSKISDVIEQFILSTLGEDSSIELSRNELAQFFSCAPSQINYVLDTRFTFDRGFIKESKRGGGGSITLIRVAVDDADDYINDLVLESIGDELSFKRATHVLNKLVDEEILTFKESKLIESAVSEDALALPLALKDKLRASIFKSVLLQLLKEKNNGK